MIGASRKLTLSPTPPVECLSTTGPCRSAPSHSSTVPERAIPVVSSRSFVETHAVEKDCHGQRRHLLGGNALVGQAVDEEANLPGAQFAAIALLANDIREQH